MPMTFDGCRLGQATGRNLATGCDPATGHDFFRGRFGGELACAFDDHQGLAAFRALDLPAHQQLFADSQRRRAVWAGEMKGVHANSTPARAETA
jgi:hypothetical protein